MLKRQLSMAWEQWQFWYAEVKDQQFKLAGALKRMMNRKLSQAWEQWQYWYAEVMDQKARLANALIRLINRKFCMAWNKWREWYENVKDQQRKLAGALQRMLHRHKSMAWNKWRAWYLFKTKPEPVVWPDAPPFAYVRYPTGAESVQWQDIQAEYEAEDKEKIRLEWIERYRSA